MSVENKETQGNVATKACKYAVAICYDDKMMGTFIKFYNRVKHPRATVFLTSIGFMMFLLPFFNEDIALPGVVICYGLGPILFFLGLFRDKLSVQMMKRDPNLKYKEELVYRFGNTGIEVQKSEGIERLGNYKKIFRLFEDEKTYYVNINEDDLIVLPKTNFVEGDPDTFKDFILDKSGAKFIWKPAQLKNKIRWYMTQKKLEREEMWAERGKNKKEKK